MISSVLNVDVRKVGFDVDEQKLKDVDLFYIIFILF